MSSSCPSSLSYSSLFLLLLVSAYLNSLASECFRVVDELIECSRNSSYGLISLFLNETTVSRLGRVDTLYPKSREISPLTPPYTIIPDYLKLSLPFLYVTKLYLSFTDSSAKDCTELFLVCESAISIPLNVTSERLSFVGFGFYS